MSQHRSKRVHRSRRWWGPKPKVRGAGGGQSQRSEVLVGAKAKGQRCWWGHSSRSGKVMMHPESAVFFYKCGITIACVFLLSSHRQSRNISVEFQMVKIVGIKPSSATCPEQPPPLNATRCAVLYSREGHKFQSW